MFINSHTLNTTTRNMLQFFCNLLPNIQFHLLVFSVMSKSTGYILYMFINASSKDAMFENSGQRTQRFHMLQRFQRQASSDRAIGLGNRANVSLSSRD